VKGLFIKLIFIFVFALSYASLTDYIISHKLITEARSLITLGFFMGITWAIIYDIIFTITKHNHYK